MIYFLILRYSLKLLFAGIFFGFLRFVFLRVPYEKDIGTEHNRFVSITFNVLIFLSFECFHEEEASCLIFQFLLNIFT